MSPDPVLSQALLVCVYCWIRHTAAVSLIAVETCGQARVHEQSVVLVVGASKQHESPVTNSDAADILTLVKFRSLLPHLADSPWRA